jgi:hypothetical protein
VAGRDGGKKYSPASLMIQDTRNRILSVFPDLRLAHPCLPLRTWEYLSKLPVCDNFPPILTLLAQDYNIQNNIIHITA